MNIFLDKYKRRIKNAKTDMELEDVIYSIFFNGLEHANKFEWDGFENHP
ncbi:MAG: hypothetical protein AB7V77_04845 [Candidatus Woesearchaeota archaeon]